MATSNKPNELNITRIYDAPLATVWDAWTDPDQVAQWWGPRGFTLTTHSKDLRTGGHWDYTMHGPDGTDYPNVTQYLEVEPHARLVYDHGGSKDRPPMFRVTVFFTALDKHRTQMDMTMSLPTPEAAAETRAFIKKAGGDATWDRLAEYLGQKASGEETFFINRSFDAPTELMFQLWTDPKHFAQWLPPVGFDMQFIEADIRTGGKSFYKMTGAFTMYGCVEYLEITKPNRLVYRQQFCDEHRNITRHPMAPTWPETMQTTVTLTAEGPAQTRVTVKWEVYGNATDVERETFSAGKPGMTMGWTGSFDKLENYLSSFDAAEKKTARG